MGIKAQGWIVGLVILFALAALGAAMVAPWAWWIKAGILAAAAWACWEIRPTMGTPKYPEEDWHIERD